LSSWFVIGQLFASVALNRLNATDPYDFRTPIYTQWAMVGIAGIIFVLIPESPWWLIGKDRFEKAEKVLTMCNGRVEGYDTHQQIVRSNSSVPETVPF
jgi:hypothetical protein